MRQYGPGERDHADDSTLQGYRSANHTPNHVYRGTKADIWEAGHRVPFFARWPGEITPDSTQEEVISLTDVFATVAEIVGHELSENEAEDSFSLLPPLHGNPWTRPRAAVIHHSSSGMFAIRDGDWKLVAGDGSGGRESPQGRPFQRPYQLFDIASDPSEQHNVYDQHPIVAQRLERKLTCIRSQDRSRGLTDEEGVLTLNLTPDSISESGAKSSMVTATLSPAPSMTTTVTVAAPAGDVTLSQNLTLTITAGKTESTGEVTLTARDNAVDGPETKTVTVSGTADDVCVAGPVTVMLTIEDDERGVTLAAGGQPIPGGELSIIEGNTGRYTVKLNFEPTAPVTIAVASSEMAVGVQPTSLRFTAANWQTAQTVTIRTEHDPDGYDLAATLTHTVPTVEGSDHTDVTVAAVAVTVTDDESPSTAATLSVNPSAVGEGEVAGRTVTVTGTLNRGVLRQDTEVTVRVAAATATAADFTAVEAFTLEIAAWDQTGTATFTLTPVDDAIDEPNETVTVSGTAPDLSDGVTSATLTITDNDNPPTLAELKLSATRISENGGTATVTAHLSNPSSEATVVGLTLPVGAEAVELSTNVLTIRAGEKSGTVTVRGVDKAGYGSHREVTLRGQVTTPASNVQRDVTLTVLDDDDPVVEGENAPTVTEGETAVAAYTAADPAGIELVWAVSGVDAAKFAIDATGRLRFQTAPDHETQESYSVTVQATDRSLAAEPLTGERVVTVTVRDAPGTVNLSPAAPRVGSRLTATVKDGDEVAAVTEWCWARSDLLDFPAAQTEALGCVSSDLTTTATYTPTDADLNHYLRATVAYTDGDGTPKSEPVERVTTAPVSLRPPPFGDGGGGGGSGEVRDDHGTMPAQATRIVLSAARSASIPGQLHAPDDVDYFGLPLPRAGVLAVETTGPTATRGTVWQDGAMLAQADGGGEQQNFRVRTPVTARPVLVTVEGQDGQTGAYTLEARLLTGYLENPGAAAFQSGIGVLSGWVCEADEVEIQIGDLPVQEAAYGTERLDTAEVCEDTDNGFGLLFNWNLLSDGEHRVVAVVDGVELDRATVQVTTLGQEFLRAATGTCEVEDFPLAGEAVTLVWQQTSQNFVLAGGSPPDGATPGRTSALTGYLENPGHNSFQSGVGVLSGWVCEAETVEITIGDFAPQAAAYGTERLDTAGVCGDTANGFGLLFNWNLLGDGEHVVVARVDGEELGRATVRVTTLGHEFLRGAEGECVVDDFPTLGETVTLEWQQSSQNFVITDVAP